MSMAKSKCQKTVSVPQKHLHSRISFLYQAATYLSSIQSTSTESRSTDVDNSRQVAVSRCSEPSTTVQNSLTTRTATTMTSSIPISSRDGKGPHAEPPAIYIHEAAPSRQLLSHLHAVSLKAQIRLSANVKHSICKRCHTLLVIGSNCDQSLENLSRGGRKAWAEVLVLKCNTCGVERRIPTGAKRQTKMTERRKESSLSHGTTVPGETMTGT